MQSYNKSEHYKPMLPNFANGQPFLLAFATMVFIIIIWVRWEGHFILLSVVETFYIKRPKNYGVFLFP